MMKTPRLMFEKYLRSQQLKLTPQRRLILEKVMARRDHFEADELVAAFQHKGERLSRATIYRTLPLLVKCGLIREVQFGDNHAHYEHALRDGHHDHLICIECGRVVEFYDESIERLQDGVCRDCDFQPVSHSLEIRGYCSRCRKGNRRLLRIRRSAEKD